MPTNDPTTPEPRRFSVTLPRPLWIRLVTVVLLIAVAAVVLKTGSVTPRASDLVQSIVDLENRIHEFPILRMRVESKGRKTERYAAHQKATKQISPDLEDSDLRDWTQYEEAVFDAKRIRLLYEMGDRVIPVQVWDGQSRKTHDFDKSDRSGDSYTLSSSFVDGFPVMTPWLRVAVHRFWWSGLAEADSVAARPDEYVLVGQERFHDRQCYLLDCHRTAQKLYVGVEDRRLCGIVTFLAPQQGLQEELTFRAETEFDNYQELSPGFWIPRWIRTTHFALDAGEAWQAWSQTDVVEVEIDPPLSRGLFDIEFPGGATVQDQRFGIWPPLEYQYKKNFSDAEWQAILASRKDDLAAAHQERREEERIGQTYALDFPQGPWYNSVPLAWNGLIRGKIVILEFTDQSCGPCRRDVLTLSELHSQREHSGIVVVAVHGAGSEPDEVKNYVEKSAIKYPLCVDAGENQDGTWSGGPIYSWFHVYGIPLSVLVDREGKIAAVGRLEDVLLKARELAQLQK